MGSETSKQSNGQRKNKSSSPSSQKMDSRRSNKGNNPRRFSSEGIARPPPSQPSIQARLSCNDGVPTNFTEEDDQHCPLRPCSESRLSVSHPSRSRSGSTVSSVSSSKSPRSPSVPTLLPMKTRQLIESCFHNQFVESIGQRILKRAAEKRKDFGQFYLSMSGQMRDEFADAIKALLKASVANINSQKDIQQYAIEFGQRLLQHRANGFKADYFATLADSTIMECVFLDNAIHPAHQTLSAFSQFITTVFSSVRDGFYCEKYNETVRLRKASSASTKKNSREERISQDLSTQEVDEAFSSLESMEDVDRRGQGYDLHEPYERCKENNCWNEYSSRNVDSKGLLMPPAI